MVPLQGTLPAPPLWHGSHMYEPQQHGHCWAWVWMWVSQYRAHGGGSQDTWALYVGQRGWPRTHHSSGPPVHTVCAVAAMDVGCVGIAAVGSGCTWGRHSNMGEGGLDLCGYGCAGGTRGGTPTGVLRESPVAPQWRQGTPMHTGYCTCKGLAWSRSVAVCGASVAQSRGSIWMPRSTSSLAPS